MAKARRTSQLFNVIKGEMSLVGPRPCLQSNELIKERQIHSIFSVKPGITGLAQVKGIDMADPKIGRSGELYDF